MFENSYQNRQQLFMTFSVAKICRVYFYLDANATNKFLQPIPFEFLIFLKRQETINL